MLSEPEDPHTSAGHMPTMQTQAQQASIALTENVLRPINTLTRASPRPGFLDYTTYLRLLIRDGHVEESHPAFSPKAPTQPVNTALQVVSADRTDNKTDFRADQAFWSQDDLPHIIYLLQPPRNWIKAKYLKEPPTKTYSIHGKLLRDIPILPDHISTDLEGWRLQAWYSFVPRVELSDVLARMGKSVNRSTIQMRALRFRADFPALGWANKGPKFNEEKTRVKDLMRTAGLDPNSGTTRGLAWGVVDPSDANSIRIDIPNRKGWESTVERATAAHLISMPSPIYPAASAGSGRLQVLPETSQPTSANRAPLAQATIGASSSSFAESHRHSTTAFNQNRNVSSVQDAANQFDTSMLDPQSEESFKTRFGTRMHEQAANIHRHTSVNTALTQSYFEESSQITMSHNNHPFTLDYPAPEEVPRVLGTVSSFCTRQWQAYDQQSAIAQQSSPRAHISPNVQFVQESQNIARMLVLHQGRWLALKTSQERKNLSPAQQDLLDAFHPVGSEERFQQLEYLLDPIQAQFGLEDRNGRWGPINWDFYGENNIVYNIDHAEANSRLAARMRRLDAEHEAFEDNGRLRFHPTF